MPMEVAPTDTNRPRPGPPESHVYSHSTNISPSSRAPFSPPSRFYPPHQKEPSHSLQPDNGHPAAPSERRDTLSYANERNPSQPASVAQSPPYPSDPNYHRSSQQPQPQPQPQPPPAAPPPPPPPIHPSSAVENQRPYPHTVQHQDKKSSMEASYSQSYYISPQHHAEPHRPPGIVTHGLPAEHQSGHPYTPLPYSAPAFIQSTGLPGDQMQGYNTSASAQGLRGQRPKAVRAQQACDNCRQRKARCDEGRPECSNCHDTGQPCTYREVPMPKSDRQIGDVVKKLENMSDTVDRLEKYIMENLPPPYPQQPGYLEARRSQPPPRFERPSQSPTINQGFRPVHLEDSGSGSHSVSIRGETARHLDSDMDTNGHEAEAEGANEDLSIPQEHTTSAHKLLVYWNSIKPFFEGIEADEEYVMTSEENRGLLRLYGRGEGREQDGRMSMPDNLTRARKAPTTTSSPGPGRYVGPDESSSTASSPDGSWGIPAINTSHTDSIHPRSSSHVGGIGPDGGLILQEEVVRSLYDSYLANIHIIQPFIDKNKKDQMIEKFIKMYSPRSQSISPLFAVPNHGPTGLNRSDSPHLNKQPKRKRESEDMSDSPYNGESGSNTPIWPERSISNAIILFILALGKICQSKDPLPSWRFPNNPPSNVNSPRSAFDSPPNHLRSPHMSNTPRTTTAPPDQNKGNFSSYMDNRRSPSNSMPPLDRRDTKLKNVDIIPGLAYYSYAASILGELFGGNTLSHMHANILAGLYNAQLIRVLDSWKYINQACIICQVLIKQAQKRGQDLTTPILDRRKLGIELPTKEIDQLLLGFWTCTQLEGDILAELDQLPHSGMSRLEDQLILPTGAAFESNFTSGDHDIIAQYYLSQIYLRKILNRMHQALYNSANNNKRKTAWSKLRAEDLMESLSDWRKMLPSDLQWDDNDPPSKHINAARMRGKYYGAVYAVHRPFLRHVLEGDKDPDPTEFSRWPIKSSGAGNNEPLDADQAHERYVYFLQKAEECVSAATRSTTAFDGVLFEGRQVKRMIVTNLFGTASAQFGNVLVLAAAVLKPQLSYLQKSVSASNFPHLMDRTIRFLKSLAPLSPTFQIEVRVLEQTKRILQQHRDNNVNQDSIITPNSASSSFNAPHP